MQLPIKMTFAALLLGTTMVGAAYAQNAPSPGCPAGTIASAAHKTDSEGGSGGNWQEKPGAGVQRTEAVASASHKTDSEGGSGGNWQEKPGAGVQRTSAIACK